jgi:hypothetical protein
MKTLTIMMILTVFVASISTFAETPINAIHGDYLARKQRYEDRVIQARKEFTALCGQKAWRLVIDKPDKGGYHSSGEAHIELDYAMEQFAKEYTAMESAAALWDMLDDPDICLNAAAYVCGADKRLTSPNFSLMANKKDRVKMDLASRAHIPGGGPKGPDFPFRPSFIGFDSQAVQADCRDKPARRLEYIEAIVKILSDPTIRKENPLEVANLLLILNCLRAKEALETMINYMFFDSRIGADYRITKDDAFDKGRYTGISGSVVGLAKIGKEYIPFVLRRFAKTTDEERSMNIGGGGAPVYALCYFFTLGMTEKDAIKAIEDYIFANQAKLDDKEKQALREILVVFKGKRYRPYYFDGDWVVPKESVTTSNK